MLVVDGPATGGATPKKILFECSIPGCVEAPMSAGEYDAHLLFHPDPIEEEPSTLSATADEEGVYSVTALGEEETW